MGARKLKFLAALAVVAWWVAGSGLALAQAPGPAAGAAPSSAPPAAGIVSRRGDYPVLDGRASDMAFVTGRHARISAQVADDIFAAGGELRVEGASADHLIMSGGELDLAPAAVHDLIAAGGRIRLRSGAVSDDVLAAGGEVDLGREAKIQGSAVVTGGRVRIATPIGGDLVMAGDRVELNGAVGRDVRIRANEVVVGPQARIDGDLYVRGASIEISPGAVVQGRTVREQVKREGRHAGAAIALLFALGVLLMHGLLAAATPWLVAPVDEGLTARPWTKVGVGALIVILTPLAMLLLAATVVGAPLALVLGLAYLLALPLAFAGVSYWIGQRIRSRVSPRRAEAPRWPARFGWTVLAALLVMLACMLPFVGWLVWLAAFATGTGALAMHLFDRRGERPPAAT